MQIVFYIPKKYIIVALSEESAVSMAKKSTTEKVVFVAIELTDNSIRDILESFEIGKKYVERMTPSRWVNPVLIALTENEFKQLERDDKIGGLFGFYELESDELPPIDERAVAIPSRKGMPINIGYGASYANFIEENRARWANVPVADIDDKWLEGTREAIKAIGDDIDNEPDDDIAETADALKDVLKDAHEACGLQFSNTVMDDMASAIANPQVFVEFMKKLKEKGLDKKFMEL